MAFAEARRWAVFAQAAAQVMVAVPARCAHVGMLALDGDVHRLRRISQRASTPAYTQSSTRVIMAMSTMLGMFTLPPSALHV